MKKRMRYLVYMLLDCQKAYPAFYIVSFILYAITVVTGVLEPLLLAHILEAVVGEDGAGEKQLAGAIGAFGICLAASPVVGVISRALEKEAEVRGQKYFGNKLFGFSGKIRLEALENPDVLDRFHGADKGGVAQFKFMDGLMRLAMRIALCVGVAMVVGRYSPILIFAGLMELIPDITTKIYFEKKVAVFNRSQRIVDRRCGYFLRLFTRKESVKEMRVMGFDKYMEDKWTEENAHKLKRLRVINMDICRKQVLGIFSINACYALNIGVAFYLMIGGLISLGAFAACLSAFSTWHSNLMMMVAELADVAKKYYVNEEYYDYFSVPTEKNGLVMYQPFRDRIVAEQVYFWYDGSESPAISGLNCEIKKGEHVVIVGENGSGKTTFSKLLTGAYLPSKGRINYDGQKTEDLNRNSLYDHISVVSQDFVRYHFTLRENVGIGNLNRMEDTKAMEALLCQIAGKELIDKTGGLDVQLGREFGGKELSGGEWQKVAIARGLWKDSDMIILDEPTSALDPLTEYDILSKFLEMIRGRTSVIISHRVGICRTADKIIVMKGGRMLECGRHQELLQAGGEYAKIWQEQAKWYL